MAIWDGCAIQGRAKTKLRKHVYALHARLIHILALYAKHLSPSASGPSIPVINTPPNRHEFHFRFTSLGTNKAADHEEPGKAYNTKVFITSQSNVERTLL